MSKSVQWILWAAGFLALFLYPKLFGIYYSNVFVTFAIFALFSVTFNLLLGYTGLLSFGHAMFFGTGGYATALLLTHVKGVPLVMAVLTGFLAAALLALLLSLLLVRVSGTAFAMLTLAFGQLMYVLCLKLRGITGGEDGVGGFKVPPFTIPGLFTVNMKDPANFFYFAIVVLGASIWILWFFTKTPFGSIQVGVRDNAMRVDYLGFKVPQTKAVVFFFSGAFAGVAGSVYAMFQNLISADGAFHVLVSFLPVMTTMIGGVGSFFGPIWGAAIFAIISEFTSRYTERVELVVGLILILVIMFAPMGFVGFVKYLTGIWSGKLPARKAMEKAS